MNSKGFCFILLLISISSAETVSLVLGGQYNFTVNGSQYAIAMVGITRDSATFVVSGAVVSPSMKETKILDLTGDSKGDVGLTLNQIMSNGTVSMSINYNVTGNGCNPIDEKCSQFNDCCVGNCIIGTCSYPPTVNVSETVTVSLDAPSNITTGSIAKLRIAGDDGKPIAYAIVGIITPSNERLTLTTNESGEGVYLVNEEGNYSYAVYGYLMSSNRTTLSSQPPLLPVPSQPQPFCGDGVCNNGETCSGCPQDCGTCPVQQVPTQTNDQEYSWLVWLGLMFLTIIIILRVLIPIFVRE
jgi:hypothetical protein